MIHYRRNNLTALIAILFVTVLLCAAFSSAEAADLLTATSKCTNYATQGIEYFSTKTMNASETDKWRYPFNVVVNGGTDGRVNGIQLEVSGSTTLYQCEESSDASGTGYQYACTSLPVGATVVGMYYSVIPYTVSSDGKFSIEINSVTYGSRLFNGEGQITYPPSPCGVNQNPANWAAATGYSLIYNTNDTCDPANEDNIIRFEENPSNRFAIVNITDLNSILSDRIRMNVSPAAPGYSYTMTLHFILNSDHPSLPVDTSEGELSKFTYRDVVYVYEADTGQAYIDASALGNLNQTDLPATLIYGELEVDAGGVFPTATNFSVQYYYENTEGTLGYENSAVHFTRSLLVRFGPSCKLDNTTSDIPSATAVTRYDPCQSTLQLFGASFVDADGNGISIDDCDFSDLGKCTDDSAVNISHDSKPNLSAYYFLTRKCTDPACTTTTGTSAYPYNITVSDGDNASLTYTASDVWSTTTAGFYMALWDRSDPYNRPFRIKSVRMMAAEAGTYEVRGFVTEANVNNGNHDNYALKFYVTVNETDSRNTCATPGTNGYYSAKWNACLDKDTTQLLTFKAKSEEHRGYIQNQSGQTMYFGFNNEYSFMPTALEMASLDCEFYSIADGSGVGNGWCDKYGISIPPYSVAYITGGSFYSYRIPDTSVEEYRLTYARTDTYNKMIMHMEMLYPDCETVEIPNTGISLRSPLKKSVEAQSNIVFTGNSLQIPAIGLGMEIPIPIVHVYYQDGEQSKGWDLSTLGGYVGELEGGQYIPYGGNSVLTGHYYSSGVFKNIGGLNPEDEIVIYANDGIKYVYRVTEKFIAQPTDLYSMFQLIGERSLTLVTCENYNLVTDKYERRQLVRATLSYQEPYEVNW